MKSTTLLSALGIFRATASAMPLAARNVTDPAISLEQAAAMGKVEVLHSAADDLPIDENGLYDGSACKAVTVLFAKGTGENGNMGDASSPGPAWAAAIQSSLGTDQVTVQGINYTASVLGYLVGGSPAGSATYLTTINDASTKCPDTAIVLGGYSQGGQILHNAAAELTAAVTTQIAAVVIFGDPDLSEAVGDIPSALVYEDCHTDDIICTGAGGAEAHLTYAEDADVTAAFVVANV